MKKIKVNLREELVRGTLLWVNANDNKVYHSSKRFDTASFNDHDSNYLGELEKVTINNKKQLFSLYDLLMKSNRIYGICLNEKGEEAILNNESTGEEVLFFPTWEQMDAFANDHFKKTDSIEAELERRKEARLKWLKRGQRYIKRQNAAAKKA